MWVETRIKEMANFKSEGTLAPEFQPGYCTNLKDDIGLRKESTVGESPTVTLLHDMIGDDTEGMFPFHMDFLTLRLSAGTQALYISCVIASVALKDV